MTIKGNFDVADPLNDIEHNELHCLAPTNDLGTYFSHLYDYSPKNTDGSCVFVSMIQVMTYYDSYYNDNIVPEEYDQKQGNASSLYLAKTNSPGVLRQDYPLSSNQLFSFVEANKYDDLQAMLMWHYNYLTYQTYNTYTYIGNPDYRQSILNSFYSNNSYAVCNSVDYSQIGSGNSYTDSGVVAYFDSYIKDQIDLGRPVILDLAYVSGGNVFPWGHAAVAYYYDSYGIHLNWGGSNSGDVDVLLPPGGNYYAMRATTINFSLMGESHSDNYVSNNTYYCGCGYHEHNYQFLEQYSLFDHRM